MYSAFRSLSLGAEAFGDTSKSGQGAGGELFLLKNFVDLALWEGLDQLVEFFGGCHDFTGVYGVVLVIMAKFYLRLVDFLAGAF